MLRDTEPSLQSDCRASQRVAELERQLADATEALRKHHSLTERVIASVDVGLLALDTEGNYELVNGQHEAHMRLTRPDGHPRLVSAPRFLYRSDGVTPMDADEVPSARAAAGETFNNVLCWAGSDPSNRRAFAVSATPHFDVQGQYAGTVLAYKDVTDLVTALRVRDEFVANVSHELRTPLTSIIGYIDLLLEEEEISDATRRLLEPVRRNSQRLHRLVDDLLSMGSGSSAAVHETERISLPALVASAVADAEDRARTADVRLVFATARVDELYIDGDAQRLHQVLDNLLSNAVKYSDSGSTVTIDVNSEDSCAVVRVSDEGRGIAQDEVDLVFDRFYRTRDAQYGAVQGIGLGLAITRAIVEGHHGTIAVQSELGRGSTFQVRLPLAAPPPECRA